LEIAVKPLNRFSRPLNLAATSLFIAAIIFIYTEPDDPAIRGISRISTWCSLSGLFLCLIDGFLLYFKAKSDTATS